jgi:hypothetical protein
MKKEKIISILDSNLIWKFLDVREGKAFWIDYISIDIAKSNYQINWVHRQYPEHISLKIQEWKLTYQIFSWCWWQYMHRAIDKNIDDEKYYALWKEKMPAIRTKDIEKWLIKVCKAYMEITEDIKKRWLSKY